MSFADENENLENYVRASDLENLDRAVRLMGFSSLSLQMVSHLLNVAISNGSSQQVVDYLRSLKRRQEEMTPSTPARHRL
jgi:hypothetical protein